MASSSPVDFKGYFKVHVGPDKVEFVVHANIVVPRSPFFEAASSKRWTAGRPGKPFELLDEAPEVFSDYLQLIYQNRVAREIPILLDKYIKLYCMADKLGDLDSANVVMDKMMFFTKETPTESAVKLAYEGTVDRSPMRRIMVHTYLGRPLPPQFELKKLPREFLEDLLKEVAEVKASKPKSSVSEAFSSPMANRPKCEYRMGAWGGESSSSIAESVSFASRDYGSRRSVSPGFLGEEE
ncbi:hypothetical protein EJ03DRAFT_384517 [Teratosphaeria nubilosa]|uniref:BTB domain-containing protein n=1 Tax=Teratosphaeria nubilosa TaxID=161662 RepID=A0A6G1L196_9PEZI|nr:hypothetical protein EJ03DRAFT_384517 [Teratosphaeria nubilosa]